MQDTLTELWGNWLLQNDFTNTFCEMKCESPGVHSCRGWGWALELTTAFFAGLSCQHGMRAARVNLTQVRTGGGGGVFGTVLREQSGSMFGVLCPGHCVRRPRTGTPNMAKKATEGGRGVACGVLQGFEVACQLKRQSRGAVGDGRLEVRAASIVP